MAASDIQGRGLICKHPSKGLKKAPAHLVNFKAEGGISAALKIDAFAPSLLSSSVLSSEGSDNLASRQINQTFNSHKITRGCRLVHVCEYKSHGRDL